MAKKKVISDGDDDDGDSIVMDYDDIPKPPSRVIAPSRTARKAAVVSTKYVEISSDEDDGDGGDDSVFIDDD